MNTISYKDGNFITPKKAPFPFIEKPILKVKKCAINGNKYAPLLI